MGPTRRQTSHLNTGLVRNVGVVSQRNPTQQTNYGKLKGNEVIIYLYTTG